MGFKFGLFMFGLIWKLFMIFELVLCVYGLSLVIIFEIVVCVTYPMKWHNKVGRREDNLSSLETGYLRQIMRRMMMRIIRMKMSNTNKDKVEFVKNKRIQKYHLAFFYKNVVTLWYIDIITVIFVNNHYIKLARF